MSWIYLVDLFGTLVFAISGVLTAYHKKFDLVGTLIIGFVTAVGGGTLRDMMIGRLPVGWLIDRNYLFMILSGYVLAYLCKHQLTKLKRTMLLFDAIGIGLFTILGIQISLLKELSIENSLLMGIISACFGGVIRDVLTNEVPLLFRKEIYASACFIGGGAYLILNKLEVLEDVNIAISILIVIVIRYCSIRYNWTLNFNK